MRGPVAARGGPLAALVVVFAAACFGTLGPVSNLAYDAGVTPTAFVFWRGAIGAAFLCGLLVARRVAGVSLAGLRDLPARQRIALGIATLAAVVLNLAIFSAFSRVPVALALLGFYTFPAMITLADVAIHKERLDAARLGALGLALTGILLVLGTQLDVGTGRGVDPLGIALAIVAAIGQTVYLLVGRHGFARVPTEQAMTVILVVSAVCFLAVAGLGGELAAAVAPLGRPAVWPFLAFAGILGAGVPSLLFLVGVRRLGGTRTAILALFEPVVGIALAAIVLGERLSPVQLLGALLVLAAAVVLLSPPARGSGETAVVEVPESPRA